MTSNILDKIFGNKIKQYFHRALVPMMFLLGAKIVSFIKDTIVAWTYGVDATVNKYIFFFNLVTFPSAILLGNMISCLIPTFGRIKQENSHKLDSFYRESIGISLYAAGIFFILYLIISFFIEDFYGSIYIEGNSYLRKISLILPVSYLSNIFLVRMIESNWHIGYALESLPSLLLILVLLIPFDIFSERLLYGTILGFFVQMGVFALILNMKKISILPKFSFDKQYWIGIIKKTGFIMAGQFFMAFCPILDQIFVSYVEDGSVMKLHYTNRLLSILSTVFAPMVSRTSIKVLSNFSISLAARKTLAIKWTFRAFFLFFIMVILFYLCIPFIVKKIYQHGNFTKNISDEICTIMIYGLLQVPLYTSSLILTSFFITIDKYKIIAFLGFLSFAVKILFLSFFIEFFGIQGVILSTSIVYMLNFLCMIYYIGVKI